MRKPTGLAWRLFGIGLLQLLVLVIAASVVSLLVARFWTRWDVAAVVDRVEPALGKPQELRGRLNDIREAGGPEISVYDEARQLLASNVEPPIALPDWSKGPPPMKDRPKSPPPTSVEQLGRLLFGFDPRGPRREMFGRMASEGRQGTLVLRKIQTGPGAWPLALSLLSGLLVVGLGAFLTARLTVRPLKKLARTAAELGAGNLTVRTQLSRSDEIGEVARAFDDMAARIQALMRVEKELMANVAHELRTPLSRIRVALEIAAEGDAAEARASLSEIAVDLAELERLVSDVLTTTSLELSPERARPGGLPLMLARVSARQVADDAVARFHARFPSRALTTALAEHLPELDADPRLLRRALDNLLENAHKYSPDAEKPVRFSAQRAGARIRFEIADEGLGIDEADLSRVFAPFFRAERSRVRSAGGVGLGLTLAKQIVEAHGGELSLSSVPGAGTRAHVLLPAAA